MVKKIFLLCAMFICIASGVIADDFVEVSHDTLTVPTDCDYYVATDFYEGNKLVRFAAGKLADYKTAKLVCTTETKKHGLLNSKKTLWYTLEQIDQGSFTSYVITQYMNKDTGRYVYGINCYWTMDTTCCAYLIGFSDDKKTTIMEYANSDKVKRPRYSNPRVFVKEGKMCLDVALKGPFDRLIYQYEWVPKDNWFGYQFITEPKQYRNP